MDVIIVLGFTCTICIVLEMFRDIIKINNKVDKILKHLGIEEKQENSSGFTYKEEE